MIELWPALDIDEGAVVRLTQGDFGQKVVYSHDPLGFVHHRFHGWPPRLHLVDLSGARSGLFTLYEFVEQLASHGVEVQCGGGIREMSTVEKLIACGARRIVVGSQLVQEEIFADRCLSRFPDFMVAALDVAEGILRTGGWEVDGPPAVQCWQDLFQRGWQRAQVTDVLSDGTMGGINEHFWQTWSKLPGDIGAGGGITTMNDLLTLERCGITRAVVGKAWIEERLSIEMMLRC